MHSDAPCYNTPPCLHNVSTGHRIHTAYIGASECMIAYCWLATINGQRAWWRHGLLFMSVVAHWWMIKSKTLCMLVYCCPAKNSDHRSDQYDRCVQIIVGQTNIYVRGKTAKVNCTISAVDFRTDTTELRIRFHLCDKSDSTRPMYAACFTGNVVHWFNWRLSLPRSLVILLTHTACRHCMLIYEPWRPLELMASSEYTIVDQL